MARKLTGPDKTAILLMTLGEDMAAEVMKTLDPKDIRKIGAMIARLTDVPEEDVAQVLQEFTDQAGKGMGLSLEGKDYIQSVLTKALGKDRATRVLETLSAAEEGGLESLKWMDPKSIAGLIRGEHPQTVALILSNLDSDQSGQIVRHLPANMRSDVMLRMATIEEIPPGVLKEVSEVLQDEMKRVGTAGGVKVGGAKMVADILNRLDHASEEAVLTSIAQNNPDLAEQIRQMMFVFEDLAKLDDRAMQQVLKEIPKEALGLALKAAKDEIKDKFFKNMSSRAVEILKEDMEAKGPVKLSEVEKAQQSILKIAQKLAEEGKIVLGGKGDTDELV
ncbi:MAG: flagellar motor switch protein FliG [Nitrospirota bacterium]